MTLSANWLDEFLRQKQRNRTIDKSARRSVFREIEAGAGRYDRNRDLPALIPLDPTVLSDDSAETCRMILARLARALRAERNRGRAGHWTYDLNRHIGLSQAYIAERHRLAARFGETMPPGLPGKNRREIDRGGSSSST